MKLIGLVHFDSGTVVKELQLNTTRGLGRFLEFSDSPAQSFIMQFPNEQLLQEWKSAIEGMISVLVGAEERHLSRHDVRSRALSPLQNKLILPRSSGLSAPRSVIEDDSAAAKQLMDEKEIAEYFNFK